MARTGRPRREGYRFHLVMDYDLADMLEKYVREHQNEPGTVTKTSVINHALRKFLSKELKKDT